MLPKNNRADKKAIDKIFKKSLFVAEKSFNFKYILENKGISPRVSVVIPKNIEKSAAKRNLLRRKTYLFIEKYIKLLPSTVLGVLVLKNKDFSMKELEDGIKNIAKRLNNYSK